MGSGEAKSAECSEMLDAEDKMRPRLLRLLHHHFSRRGFFILIQSFDRPETASAMWSLTCSRATWCFAMRANLALKASSRSGWIRAMLPAAAVIRSGGEAGGGRGLGADDRFAAQARAG
jgi:hypothetical protein